MNATSKQMRVRQDARNTLVAPGSSPVVTTAPGDKRVFVPRTGALRRRNARARTRENLAAKLTQGHSPEATRTASGLLQSRLTGKDSAKPLRRDLKLLSNTQRKTSRSLLAADRPSEHVDTPRYAVEAGQLAEAGQRLNLVAKHAKEPFLQSIVGPLLTQHLRTWRPDLNLKDDAQFQRGLQWLLNDTAFVEHIDPTVLVAASKLRPATSG